MSSYAPPEPLPADLAVMDAEQMADVLVDRIEIAKRAHAAKRPAAFTARDALLLLRFESLLVATAASNVAEGVALTRADLERLWHAHRRIHEITDEIAPTALRKHLERLCPEASH